MEKTDKNEKGKEIAKEDKNNSLIEVASFYTFNEASMCRLKLQAEGIDVFLDNENIVSSNPLYAQATGGIKILVPKEHTENALKIIGSSSSPNCPQCQSINVIIKPHSKAFMFFSFLALTIPLVCVPRKWLCKDCGYIFK